MQTDLAKPEVGWFVGCEENLVDASLQSDSYVCLGTCELKYVNTHKSQFLEFWLKQWFLKNLLRMESDLQQVGSGLVELLWRKTRLSGVK